MFCGKRHDFYYLNDERGMARNDFEMAIVWSMLKGKCKGTVSAEGYSAGDTSLNLSDKDQNCMEYKYI